MTTTYMKGSLKVVEAIVRGRIQVESTESIARYRMFRGSNLVTFPKNTDFGAW